LEPHLKNSQELHKCQKIVDSVIQGYLGMLERKTLLQQSIMQANSMFSQLEPNLLNSVKIIQDTLYASLLIDIYAWLFDQSKNSSNLSTHKLLEKLNRKDFKNKLESYYIEPPATIPLGNDTDQFWHQQYKSDKLEEFQKIIDDCKKTYNSFLESEVGKRIKSIRDKLLAHKEGAYSTKDNGHNIGEAINSVEKMRTIVLLLNQLMQKCSYPIEEMEEAATKKAELFWQHVLHT
jgi:hypothetical protein